MAPINIINEVGDIILDTYAKDNETLNTPKCEWKMCLIKNYGNFIRMSSGQTSLLLQIQLRGYKSLDPTMKHQKAIPENLVLHIYKRTNTHLTTSIDQLVAGEFFFGMQSCKYWTTPKGEDKRTRIFEKRDISFL